MLISRGCLRWREEPSHWPLQGLAWLPVHFVAFHVVRGSSEQMTQQPESLGPSGLSAFREVIGRIYLGLNILSLERMEI